MAKKIVGIILIAAAVMTVLLGMKAGFSNNQQIIEDAVYITDGKLLAENEGKVVIVTGALEAPLPFVDQETGVPLHSIFNYRRVEKLSISENTQTEKEEWSWNMTVSENDYGGSEKVIAPGVMLGEFAVSEELLQSVSISQNRTQYDKKELNKRGWNKFEDDDRVYLYQGDIMPYEDSMVGKYYKDYLGSLRVSYDEISPESTLEYTIIGQQKDGKLEKVENLDMTPALSGHLTVEQLHEKAAADTKTAVITAIMIAVALAGIGVFLILRSGKKKT
jgi:multisubunit Na+/H+ antiporter MnhC subunit